MKKLIQISIFVFIFFLSTFAYALTFTGTNGTSFTYDERDTVGSVGAYYSGQYLFTVTDPKNDNLGTDETLDLYGLINYQFSEFSSIFGGYELDTLSFFDKVEELGTSSVTGPLELTYDGTNMTGSWSTAGYNVEFYSVKSANDWALYWLGEAGLSSGLWSTEHLVTPNGINQPIISHLSTWNATVAPVPEPSTLLLLGAGITGLAFYRRKKK